MTESERLIPVTQESELKTGMRVICRNCDKCGQTHRYFLLNWRQPDDRKHIRAWAVHPLPTCFEEQYLYFIFAIEEGRLFRIDDGMDKEEGYKDEVRSKLADSITRLLNNKDEIQRLFFKPDFIQNNSHLGRTVRSQAYTLGRAR